MREHASKCNYLSERLHPQLNSNEVAVATGCVEQTTINTATEMKPSLHHHCYLCFLEPFFDYVLHTQSTLLSRKARKYSVQQIFVVHGGFCADYYKHAAVIYHPLYIIRIGQYRMSDVRVFTPPRSAATTTGMAHDDPSTTEEVASSRWIPTFLFAIQFRQ